MADSPVDGAEDVSIAAKHRKERKDLQSKIQALKKTASKGDKKKRKEVLEEIAKLEIDLDKKQADELNGAHESKEELENHVEELPKDETEENESKQKISKAQRRRDKKARDIKQREEDIANFKVSDDDPRLVESRQLSETLISRGLRLFPIPSDGNCLYNAIKHQLQQTGRNTFDVSHLRNETANYILKNKDTLICYMTNTDTGNLLTDEEFEEYCDSVRNTSAWGGQVEITALSSILNVPIEVLQANAPPTVQGADDVKGPNLVLTYHRHMYSLGAHYNSTVPVSKEQKSDDVENNSNEN